MGVVGDLKRLATEAREKIAAGDIEGANATIAAIGELAGKFGQIADDITETELVKDLDAAVESIGQQFPEIAKAARGLIDHLVRVGTRASLAAQEATRLLAEIREHGFETHSRIAKPKE